MSAISGFPRLHREYNKIYYPNDIIKQESDTPDDWGNITVTDNDIADSSVFLLMRILLRVGIKQTVVTLGQYLFCETG